MQVGSRYFHFMLVMLYIRKVLVYMDVSPTVTIHCLCIQLNALKLGRHLRQ